MCSIKKTSCAYMHLYDIYIYFIIPIKSKSKSFQNREAQPEHDDRTPVKFIALHEAMRGMAERQLKRWMVKHVGNIWEHDGNHR